MSEMSKERKILQVMRKVLANIVKETTPPPGMRHPIPDHTIEDIKMAFTLISSRERELAAEDGVTEERPYFTDEKPAAKVVPISGIGRVNKIPE